MSREAQVATIDIAALPPASWFRARRVLWEVGHKFGRWLDLVVMQRFLDALVALPSVPVQPRYNAPKKSRWGNTLLGH
jgi:hypothetical protein